jgi:hypothetical protein
MPGIQARQTFFSIEVGGSRNYSSVARIFIRAASESRDILPPELRGERLQ